MREALNEVRGAYAIGVMHLDHPNRIVGARMNVPLIVGLGSGEGFLASDVPAILEHTKNMVILQEGDIADVTPEGVKIIGMDGVEVNARSQDRGNIAGPGEGRFRPHPQGDLDSPTIGEAMRAAATGRNVRGRVDAIERSCAR